MAEKETATMKQKHETDGEGRPVDPIATLILHAVLVAGFLAVHFGVARLW